MDRVLHFLLVFCSIFLHFSAFGVEREKTEEPEKRQILIFPIRYSSSDVEGYASMVNKIVASIMTEFDDYETITMEEVKELLTLEQKRQLLGCETQKCLSDIGNILGADYILSGSVSRQKDTLSLILILIDSRSSRVVSRSAVLIRSEERFPEFTKKALFNLFRKDFRRGLNIRNLIVEKRRNRLFVALGLNSPGRDGLEKGGLFTAGYSYTLGRFRLIAEAGINGSYIDLETSTNPAETPESYTASLSSFFIDAAAEYILLRYSDIMELALSLRLGFLVGTSLVVAVSEDTKSRLPELVDGSSSFWGPGIRFTFLPFSTFAPSLEIAYRASSGVLLKKRVFNPFGEPLYEEFTVDPVGSYIRVILSYRF